MCAVDQLAFDPRRTIQRFATTAVPNTPLSYVRPQEIGAVRNLFRAEWHTAPFLRADYPEDGAYRRDRRVPQQTAAVAADAEIDDRQAVEFTGHQLRARITVRRYGGARTTRGIQQVRDRGAVRITPYACGGRCVQMEDPSTR